MPHLPVYATGDPIFCFVYHDIIVPTICLVSLITMLPPFHKYIKSKNIKNKCLYWSGLIFFIAIFASIILMIVFSFYRCRDAYIYGIVYNLLTQSYVIQTLLLLGILFARLYFVFKRSSFALSTTAIKSYWIFFSLVVVDYISAGIVFANPVVGTTFGLTIIASAFAMLIIMVVWLVILFLYKLIQVYKIQKGNDKSGLVGVITKTSILTIISIFATLLNALTAIAGAGDYHNLIAVFDFMTNFWCIILSFNGYHDWYRKMCGYCDSKCAACLYKIVLIKMNQTNEQERVESCESSI